MEGDVPRAGTARLAVGCDAQGIAAVAESIRLFGPAYLARVLHPAEIARAERIGSPARQAAHVAGRYAAKEAVFKTFAAGPGDALPWHDIEIADSDTGPVVRLHGRAARLAERRGISRLVVTIGDASPVGVAIATAIATIPPL